jgi:hypothetical protein
LSHCNFLLLRKSFFFCNIPNQNKLLATNQLVSKQEPGQMLLATSQLVSKINQKEYQPNQLDSKKELGQMLLATSQLVSKINQKEYQPTDQQGASQQPK